MGVGTAVVWKPPPALRIYGSVRPLKVPLAGARDPRCSADRVNFAIGNWAWPLVFERLLQIGGRGTSNAAECLLRLEPVNGAADGRMTA